MADSGAGCPSKPNGSRMQLCSSGCLDGFLRIFMILFHLNNIITLAKVANGINIDLVFK